MPVRETEYRGYKIQMKPTGREWRLAVSPTRPDLPLMRQYSFRLHVSSADEAIAQAQRRVDMLLELSSMFPKR